MPLTLKKHLPSNFTFWSFVNGMNTHIRNHSQEHEERFPILNSDLFAYKKSRDVPNEVLL